MSVNNKNERLKQVFSSSGGAIITALLMTPLDVIKIRLQAQTRQLHKGDCFVYRNGLIDQVCTCFNGQESWYNRKIPGGRYTGSIDAFVKIIRYEGVTSLWSGLPPTLAMSFPQVVLYFSIYHEAKYLFGYHEINNPNPILPIISGGIARLTAVTVVSPLELVRTKMQSEKLKYSQIGEKVKLSVENYGIRSLYRGLVPTIWRDVPFSMIYWFNYETLKTNFLKYQQKNSLDTFTTFFCGATAGSIAAIITCPLDVVKTYRQVELGELNTNKSPRKTIDVIKDIYRMKGYKALFTGINFFLKRF